MGLGRGTIPRHHLPHHLALQNSTQTQKRGQLVARVQVQPLELRQQGWMQAGEEVGAVPPRGGGRVTQQMAPRWGRTGQRWKRYPHPHPHSREEEQRAGTRCLREELARRPRERIQGIGGLGNWERADHNQGAWSTAAPSHYTSRAA